MVLPLIFDVAGYQTLPGPELARRAFAEAFGPSDEPAVLFLSRLHPKKRLEALIEAAGLLRDEGIAFRLLVAGTGEPAYERSLRDLVGRLGLQEKVAFVGFVSGQKKVSLYQAAAVSVLPTSQENWGFALIESLAAGTPVVTTRGVDIWSELETSGAAVIVDQAPAAIAGALTSLLRDPACLSEMRDRGRRWVLEQLDADHVIRQYEALYESVRGDRHAAGGR